MNLSALQELAANIFKINEITVLISSLLLIIILSFIKRKLKMKRVNKFSSIDIKDDEKNIKYRGPASGAMLIVLLNYLRKKGN